MLVTVSWISKKYDEFNKKLFEGKLPNIKFKVGRSKYSWGFASYRYDWVRDTIIPEAITISNYYDSPEKVKIQTLLHEMIHIADYTFHPEHFIKNGRRVSGRIYNAHGYWFMNEANRISRETGYDVNNHVTNDERKASSLSGHSQRLIDNKKNNALICAVIGKTGIWWFKTDVNKVGYLKRTLKNAYRWEDTIGEFKTIKFYTFKNERLAARRSCEKRISGWRTTKFDFIKKMEEFKATEVRF